MRSRHGMSTYGAGRSRRTWKAGWCRRHSGLPWSSARREVRARAGNRGPAHPMRRPAVAGTGRATDNAALKQPSPREAMATPNPVAEFTDTPLPAAAYARFRAAFQPQVRIELIALEAALGRY